MANDINVTIGADIRGIQQSLDRIEGQTRRSASSMTSLWTGVGAAMVSAFSMNQVLEAMGLVIEFDDNLRQTQAAAGLTADQFEKLKQKALELGREPGQTPAMIAAGMADAARAGRNFDEIMQGVASTAQLAAASELNFSEATESSVDIMAQYGLKASEQGRVTDVLIAGANSASVKVSQLTESFKFAGAMSSSLGVSLEETTAQLLVLANSGIKAEMGGTALRGIWAMMIKKSDELNERFGVQISRIENGKQVYRSLADIIDDLNKSSIQASDVFEIFGNRAGPGAAVLLKQGGDAIREYTEKLENAGGTGAKVAETLQSGIGGAFRTITSEGQNAVILFGSEIAPAFELVADNAYLLTASVEAVIGVIRTARSIHADLMASWIDGVSVLAGYTDALGITTDAAESLTQVSKDLRYVADQAGESGAEMFSKAYDEITNASKNVKEHTETVKESDNAVKQLGTAYQDFETDAVTSVNKVVEAEKKATEQRKKDIDDMQKYIMSSSTEYFQNQANEILKNVEKWRELGANEIELQQYAYDEISDISRQAYDEGNAEAGRYFQNLTAQYTSAVRSITAENQALTEQYKELTGKELYFDDTTDWEGVKNEIEDIKNSVDNVDNETIDIEDSTDLSSSIDDVESLSDSVESVSDEEIEISVDTSNVESAEGVFTASINSVQGLEQAISQLNETPTLDPFGNIREGYEKMIGELNNIESVGDEIRSALFGLDDSSELASKYEDKLDELAGIEKTKAEEIADFRREALEEIQDERLKQEKDYQERRIELEKDSYDKSKDLIKDQLDAAKDALDAAKDAQDAYWENQIDQQKKAKDDWSEQLDAAKDFYDSLEEERDAVHERYQEQAEAEYQTVLDNYQKKLQLIKDEENLRNEQLSFLKEIYEESGEAGKEYYKAEADALAEKAQEMKDSGISSVYIEKWLQDQLGELRDKANEEGIRGISSYTDNIVKSYKQTGVFSKTLVDNNEKIKALTNQINQLKETGADQFFDEAGFAAYGFDEKLVSAQENITNIESNITALETKIDDLQNTIDVINGDTFIDTGKTAQDLANDVSNAESTVEGLENALKGVEDQLDALEEKKKSLDFTYSVTVSSSSSSSSSKNKGSLEGPGLGDKHKLPKRTYSGGGYTGNGLRSGGVDGQGGFFAILHPQETVIDHTKSVNNSVDNSSKMLLNKLDELIKKSSAETTVYVGSINVDKTMTASEIDRLVADLKRRERRG